MRGGAGGCMRKGAQHGVGEEWRSTTLSSVLCPRLARILIWRRQQAVPPPACAPRQVPGLQAARAFRRSICSRSRHHYRPLRPPRRSAGLQATASPPSASLCPGASVSLASIATGAEVGGGGGGEEDGTDLSYPPPSTAHLPISAGRCLVAFGKGFRRFNSDIPPGATIVTGTNQGLYATAARHANMFRIVSCDNKGETREVCRADGMLYRSSARSI